MSVGLFSFPQAGGGWADEDIGPYGGCLAGGGLAPGGGAGAQGLPMLPGQAAGKDNWETAIQEALAERPGEPEGIDISGKSGRIASTGAIFKTTSELERHIQYVDPSAPRRRGIGGAHSSEAFFKNDVKIVKAIPSQDIPGVTLYKYNLPVLGKDGQPMGGYGITAFKKTVYDPSILSDTEYLRRGLEAANESLKRNHGLGGQWQGFDSYGVKWVGYGKEGKPTSFFPDIPEQ